MHDVLGTVEMEDGLCLPTLRQSAILLVYVLRRRYAFLAFEELSLLFAPGEAVNEEIRSPVLQVLDETTLEDIVNVGMRDERSVAHDSLDIKLLSVQRFFSFLSE